MKTFIVINGTKVSVIERENMEDAREYATNFMNHSYEIIVREITNFTFKQKKSQKLLELVQEWDEEAELYKKRAAQLAISSSTLLSLNKEIFDECSKLGITIKDLKLS